MFNKLCQLYKVRHCEGALATAAIQSLKDLAAFFWIASLALAMTDDTSIIKHSRVSSQKLVVL